MKSLRLLPFLVLFPLLANCKSYHNDASVREAIRSHSSSTGTGDGTSSSSVDVDDGSGNVVDNSLIIKRLELPSEVSKYDRICVILQSEALGEKVETNYALDTSLPLTPDDAYTLTLGLYQGSELRYANVTCDSGRSFTAKKGRNIFTVPVCSPAAEDENRLAACKL